MAKQRLRRKDSAPSTAVSRLELDTEFANRLIDPFETHYLGILRTNDPLLLERGNGGVELYRDLRRDGKVFSGLQKRQLALVGKSWQVEPVDKENAKAKADAEVVTHILKGFGFDQMCKDFLESLLAGFSVGETVWTIRDDLVVPERVIKRAQRRFVFVQDDEHAPAQLHLLTRNAMQRGIPVPESKFIVHRVNPEDDNPYGTGLGLQLFWPVYFKRKGIVAWNKLCDRFGSPTPHGKYPRGASPKEKATLADALRAFSNDGWMMTPEGMDIALLESKLSGNVTTQQQLCEYMDDWIAEILTGQEPARASGGAVAAASKERRDVRQDLTQADSDLLSDTLNSTLIKWICELNGLEPCLVYRNIKEEDDVKALAEADKLVYDMGFELDEDTVRAKYGEGWSKKQAAPNPFLGKQPLDPKQQQLPPKAEEDAEAETPPNFAEPGTRPGAEVTSQLAAGAAPVVAGWITQLRKLVHSIDEPQQLQEALLAQFGDLPSSDLQELMGLAFELAELQGRDSATQEMAGG